MEQNRGNGEGKGVAYMNFTSNGYVERLAELNNLYLASGFSMEQLLDMFMASYTISAQRYGTILQLMPEDIGPEKKEAPTMQVTYNGFTGELVKLEKKETDKYTLSPYDMWEHPVWGYDLSIYDSEKQVTYSFAGVKLEDVKFMGGAVSFGG